MGDRQQADTAAEPSADGGESARRRRSPAMATLGLLLIVAAAGTVVVAGQLPDASAQATGGNLPINATAADRLDATVHNSPAVVAHPSDRSRLAVVSRIARPRMSCGLHVSTDGGRSWQATGVPVADDTVTVPCFSPDATYTTDGRLHVAFTSFARLDGAGTVPEAVWVVSSDGQGGELAAPVRAAGPLAFHVRVAADPSDPGRLYLAWVQTSGAAGYGFTEAANPVVVARSDDGGSSWSEPVRVSPDTRLRPIAPNVAVADDGTAYVAYLDLGDDRLDYHGAHDGMGGPAYPGSWELVVARSADGGASWVETTVDAGVVPIGRVLILHPPAPAIATGPGGRVHVGFHDARGGDADVWVWSSHDGGASWTSPVKAHDTPAGDGTTQHLPELAVADSGRLDVVFYDRRSDPDDVMTQVALASSYDRGATFSSPTVVSDIAFDATIGPGAERGLVDLGDRLGLVSTSGGALAVWADTRVGERVTGKQDLARAVVAITGPPDARVPLRIASGAAGLLGLALVVAASRRERSIPPPVHAA